jgi:hypothetical protein
LGKIPRLFPIKNTPSDTSYKYPVRFASTPFLQKGNFLSLWERGIPESWEKGSTTLKTAKSPVRKVAAEPHHAATPFKKWELQRTAKSKTGFPITTFGNDKRIKSFL